ncbi:PEP-CTERM sorting domain-containing protein [Alteromonas sediminis]|uniref:PEP-CTERM sorting domain-containing protein n=1 Tax=Alteromonas sediminis TaxID=2259342 RepID=A0A3N5ZED0_9ALTE|nr:PEP-CTERM sorting domain-containing protein [Alteromonas sediminis]RPJ68718.1 PEP-CTERM sorting domain-containing protein [Alteromonas sediminis]
MIKRIKTALLAMACLAALPASANLIINGSFEDNDVQQGKWKWFYAEDVNGWNGSTIEIWDNFKGIDATEGNQFAELNAHSNGKKQFGIFQTFQTNVGQTYDVSFAYRARQSNKEAFEIGLSDSNDVSFFNQIMDDHIVGEWSFFKGSFVSTTSTTSLWFSTVNPYSGTVGNFIDNISVTSVNNVPAPTVWFLIVSALTGLFVFKKQRQRLNR